MPSTLGIVSSGAVRKPEWTNVVVVNGVSQSSFSFRYGYSDTQSITFLSDHTISFGISGGSLPLGCTASSTGNTFTITGTVVDKSSFSFTVRATNFVGFTETTFTGTPAVEKMSVTTNGGTYADHNGWRTYTFTGLNTLTVNSGRDDLQIAMLAGGGGGAGDGNGAGGGGAGGYATWTRIGQAGTYTISVGGGGAAGGNYQEGTSGTNSTFTRSDISLSLTANGGGGGGDYITAINGGCGGGGGFAGSRGIGSQGFNGGFPGFYNGGGGGGIGGNGSDGNSSPNETGGNGGSGANTPPSGWAAIQTVRGGGGGGGGGAGGSTSSGGSGGGGAGRGGAVSPQTGSAGTAQYGAGGGGGYAGGGAGGSGIVFVRFPIPDNTNEN